MEAIQNYDTPNRNIGKYLQSSLGKAGYISSPPRQNHHSEDSNSGHLWVRLGTKVMQKHSKNTIFRGHIIWDLYSLSVQDVSEQDTLNIKTKTFEVQWGYVFYS